jgi:hypothetical protein
VIEDAGRDLDPVAYGPPTPTYPDLNFLVTFTDDLKTMSVTAPSWPDSAIINPDIIAYGITWTNERGEIVRRKIGYRRGNKLCIEVDNGYAEYVIGDEVVEDPSPANGYGIVFWGVPTSYPVCHRVYVRYA